MPDYQKGKIYKLWSPQGNEIYIGSTTNLLANRFAGHKSKHNCSSKYLFQNYTDVRIELIEAFACNNKMELNKREGEHIRVNDCLNKLIAGRTKQEWQKQHYENNKEQIAEYKKEWYEDNKEKIAEYHKEWYEANKEKKKEYYEANKEKLAEKKKERYEANKEEILERMKEKIKCECGCEVSRNNIPRHRRSNNHKEIMLMLQQHQD